MIALRLTLEQYGLAIEDDVLALYLEVALSAGGHCAKRFWLDEAGDQQVDWEGSKTREKCELEELFMLTATKRVFAGPPNGRFARLNVAFLVCRGTVDRLAI